ncbi:MAG: hypothetical protein EA405_11075 [Rhodospirillales bacterium]|nr:MAG: hypothetical protein EA405_11075 [Rhodospirillales bacterium]
MALAMNATAPSSGSAAAPQEGCVDAVSDPRGLYGDELRFRVLRDGRPVGAHRVHFRNDGDRVIADTRFDLEVRVLFFSAYRYSYRSQDVWRDGCLVSLSAETDDNGSLSRVTAERRGDELHVQGPTGGYVTDPAIFPTTHWNASVVDSDRVLNTINGRVARVTVEPLGPSTVMVAGQPVTARHYRYSGDLHTEVWYDPDGRWVKMRFEAKDGSTIEYECEVCRPEHGTSPGSA